MVMRDADLALVNEALLKEREQVSLLLSYVDTLRAKNRQQSQQKHDASMGPLLDMIMEGKRQGYEQGFAAGKHDRMEALSELHHVGMVDTDVASGCDEMRGRTESHFLDDFPESMGDHYSLVDVDSVDNNFNGLSPFVPNTTWETH
jgi:hypothetical protein